MGLALAYLLRLDPYMQVITVGFINGPYYAMEFKSAVCSELIYQVGELGPFEGKISCVWWKCSRTYILWILGAWRHHWSWGIGSTCGINAWNADGKLSAKYQDQTYHCFCPNCNVNFELKCDLGNGHTSFCLSSNVSWAILSSLSKEQLQSSFWLQLRHLPPNSHLLKLSTQCNSLCSKQLLQWS